MPISSETEQPKIEVKSYDEKRFGLYLNGQIIGVSKHDFDCDFAAHKLAGIFEERIEVDLHPELRKK